MISGTKISQLPVVTNLQDTDYLPLTRGVTTNRISGLTVNNVILSTVKANFPIDYTSNTFTLSSNNIISLKGNSVNIQSNTFSVSSTQVIEVSSLLAALRVTQTGFGNALLIEDSFNPDNTPFVVTSAGNVGIGTLIPSNKLHIHTTASDTASSAHIKLTQTTNSNESYIATDTQGYTRLGGVAGIGLVVLSAGEVVSVLSAGNVGIGSTNPNEKLTVSGNISANTFYGYLSGNAETATKWNTARLATLSGAIYGSASLDGSQNITIFTNLSTEVITNSNIASNANISDTKLGPILSVGKVAPIAIDTTGSQPTQVLVSTGAATIWQSLSSTSFTILPSAITTNMLNNGAVTESKITNGAVTSQKLNIDNGLTVVGNISATGTVYSSNTLTTSICAMSGNGVTPFIMQFTNGLLTSITF